MPTSTIFDDEFSAEEFKMSDRESRELEQLYQQIQILAFLLQKKMMKKWNRNLPLNELLADRWEKAEQLGYGEGTSIYDSSHIFGNVSIGKQTWIGPFTILDGSGGLKIGDFCSISSGVQIYTHDSAAWSISGGKNEILRSPTSIGSRCYIGPNTIVTKGVTIGDGSIVGAMSLVTKDIPLGSTARGIPAKIVGKAPPV